MEFIEVCTATSSILLLGGRNYTIIDVKEGIVKFSDSFERQVEISSASCSKGLAILTFWDGTVLRVNLRKERGFSNFYLS